MRRASSASACDSAGAADLGAVCGTLMAFRTRHNLTSRFAAFAGVALGPRLAEAFVFWGPVVRPELRVERQGEWR